MDDNYELDADLRRQVAGVTKIQLPNTPFILYNYFAVNVVSKERYEPGVPVSFVKVVPADDIVRVGVDLTDATVKSWMLKRLRRLLWRKQTR